MRREDDQNEQTKDRKRPSPKEFFSKHAAHYASSTGHATGMDLRRLIELLEPRATQRALDVATGTGFTAMELAMKTRAVVATDITEEMLEQARKLATRRGIKNILFQRAEASSLPYTDSSFDLVTSRRAPHHFGDIPKFLREAHRVLRVGGLLGVADMSPPSQQSAEFFNHLELIRDKTHRRALTLSEWRGEIASTGLSVIAAEKLTKYVSFEEWLEPVPMGGAEEAAVAAAWLRAPVSVQEQMGLRVASGRITGWTKRWTLIVARK